MSEGHEALKLEVLGHATQVFGHTGIGFYSPVLTASLIDDPLLIAVYPGYIHYDSYK